MKKLIASLFLTLASTLVFADDIVEESPSQPTVLILVVGIIALGALFYVRYRRARNK